jgi:hypothetical protein
MIWIVLSTVYVVPMYKNSRPRQCVSSVCGMLSALYLLRTHDMSSLAAWPLQAIHMREMLLVRNEQDVCNK